MGLSYDSAPCGGSPAPIIHDCPPDTVASAYHSEDKRGEAERAETKAAAEKERLKEKKAIWDFIHAKSGQQIVKAVKASTPIGSISFLDWVTDVGDHLKFGQGQHHN